MISHIKQHKNQSNNKNHKIISNNSNLDNKSRVKITSTPTQHPNLSWGMEIPYAREIGIYESLQVTDLCGTNRNLSRIASVSERKCVRWWCLPMTAPPHPTHRSRRRQLSVLCDQWCSGGGSSIKYRLRSADRPAMNEAIHGALSRIDREQQARRHKRERRLFHKRVYKGHKEQRRKSIMYNF